MTARHAAADVAESGHRTFTWFTPARRKPTEYELYTVGQQSGPDQWLNVDWPVRFDDGSPPWSEQASAVRTTNWRDYRDPSALWQRPYVSHANQDQQALARIVPVLARASAANTDAVWSKEILGRVYAAWPFAEYGLFLSLSYGVRQALSDSVQFTIVFQAADRLRLLQDIVFHLDALGEEAPAFSDEGAREAWMTDPALVGVRELVEHIVASTDWVESLVVGTLLFEPLIGRLAKTELFARRAPLAGDSATPAVLAGAERDAARHVECVQALVRLVCADPTTGAANRAVIERWIADWGPRVAAAAEAFSATFLSAGAPESERAAALARARAHQSSAIEGAFA